MGSQQLLLLVISFIVVVLMIYTGAMIYNSYAETSNRDNLISILTQLGSSAQQYIKKPVNTGGGGGEFTGWILPATLVNTDYGEIMYKVRDDRINLTARGIETGLDGDNEVRINAIVRKNSIEIRIKN